MMQEVKISESDMEKMDKALEKELTHVSSRNMQKCPNCKKEIDLNSLEISFHKLGRRAKCCLCGKRIVFSRFIR